MISDADRKSVSATFQTTKAERRMIWILLPQLIILDSQVLDIAW